MKHSFMYGFLIMAVFASIATATPALADVATSTSSSTAVTATTTISSTTTTPVVSATTTATSSHIADLLAQLAKLTALFNDLKAKLFGVQAQIAEVTAGLRQGSTGDDVKAIQEALASDPSIYPSGLKTGFFGPMTVDAIKKFQAKNGLAVTGEINQETKAALDTILASRHKEGHFPFGLLIAPGQHRDEFEGRLRTQCGASTTAAVGTSTPALGCAPLMQKYHLDTEGDDDRQGSSTMSGHPMNMMIQKESEKHGPSHDSTSSATETETDDAR